jgi:archaellum biogenesis ATPase FlaH
MLQTELKQETPVFFHSVRKSESKPETQKKKNHEEPSFTLSSLNTSFLSAKNSITAKKNLFGDLIAVGDLSILFGRSNTGKSFLGYQIAEAIASGKNVLDVLNPISTDLRPDVNQLLNESQPEKVIYFDFEGTKEKNYLRYSDSDNNAYKFNENISVGYPEKLSVYDSLQFVDAMEKAVLQIGAKYVIIDNISALSQDSEKSGNAVKLMNKIKDFQRRNNLTVILLAHTPKILEGQPIVGNNLAGSSNLFNLADSVLALNTTNLDTSIRYIKQLKSRYNEIQYDCDNVITIKFNTLPNGLKGYEFLAYESEYELIKLIEKSVKDEENEQIISRIKNFNLSAGEIAKDLHSVYAVNVDIKTYRERIKKRIQVLKQKGLIPNEQPTASQPKPEAKPTASKPEAKPTASQPTAKPIASQPKPTASQPEEDPDRWKKNLSLEALQGIEAIIGRKKNDD